MQRSMTGVSETEKG